ncbi:MAG: carboxypeptidase M32 [Gammaproteobacteria bacterium]|nr:carboxypeptidase M32 [Gammaproteobacteria bacterium]
MSAQEHLRDKLRVIHNLNHASQYLSWDEAVMMPKEGGIARADSLATLRFLVHEIITSTELGELIEAAKDERPTDKWEIANLRVIEHERVRSTAVPSDLVVALSKASSACEQEWRERRAENDWKSVVPLLSAVVRLTKERAVSLGEVLQFDPYDALLDEYEPGLNQKFIDPLFSRLVEFLPGFVDDILTRQGPRQKFQGNFSPQRQLELAKRLMAPLGFNFSQGRIDTSHHPFSCGNLTDTRITTRFGDDDFLESMYAVLHETGHALYQQGLPRKPCDQPVGRSLGMMIHESQSLFMEMQICRGNSFLRFAKPIIEDALDVQGNGTPWNLETLSKAVRRVERGKIRVESDETTYPLHVVLRYEIEKALLRDELTVEEIPEMWNQLMKDSFGIELGEDYKDGCMQDVHWFAGLIGYFPCYSLGALTAAQLYQAMVRDIGDIEDDFAAGQFERSLGWQRDKIHSRGQLIPSFELIESVTGSPLGCEAFISHVTSRYGSAS